MVEIFARIVQRKGVWQWQWYLRCLWLSTTDYPQESAQALLAAEYVRKTKMYEPRARVVRVEWTDSKAHDGNITPKVVIDLV